MSTSSLWYHIKSGCFDFFLDATLQYIQGITICGDTLHTMGNYLPDMPVLDIWMSGWHGRDICHFLKSQEKTRHLPILLVSANRETESIAREAGADDFLAKPFDLDKLLEKIECCL